LTAFSHKAAAPAAQSLATRSPFNVETDLVGVSIAVYVPFVLTAHPQRASKGFASSRDAAATRQKPEIQLRLDWCRFNHARAEQTPKDIIERLQRVYAVSRPGQGPG
jgi:hypothetical protein